jgi:hypothetical protein
MEGLKCLDECLLEDILGVLPVSGISIGHREYCLFVVVEKLLESFSIAPLGGLN